MTYNVLPQPGTLVHIITKHPNINYYTRKSEPFVTNIIHGTVIQRAKDDPPDVFRVLTGKPEHPVALITLGDHITSMVNVKTGIPIKGNPSTPRNVEQIFEMKGSKGDIYVVKNLNGAWSCKRKDGNPCPAFTFRHRCHHIDEAKEQLNDRAKGH